MVIQATLIGAAIRIIGAEIRVVFADPGDAAMLIWAVQIDIAESQGQTIPI